MTAPEGPAGADASVRQEVPWGFLLAFVAPLMAFVSFGAGFYAMDQSEPSKGAAGALYVVGALIGGAAPGILMSRRRWWPLAVSLPLAGAFGPVVATLFDGAYDEDFLSVVWWGLGASVLVGYGLAAGAGACVGRRAGAAWAVQATGAGVAGAWAVACLFHLASLDRQATEAAAAHETPGIGLLPLLAVLGLAALGARRSALSGHAGRSG